MEKVVADMVERKEKDAEKAESAEDLSQKSLKFGLDYVFNVSNPIFPGDLAPSFSCEALEEGEKMVTITNDDIKDCLTLIVFYSKDFSIEGNNTLNLLADFVANNKLPIKVLAVSTDSVAVHKAWVDQRELGSAVSLLADTTGLMARSFGVLDMTTHLAYSAYFLIDRDGFVQLVNVAGLGGIGVGGVGDLLNLVNTSS